jgi:hypothetical protein
MQSRLDKLREWRNSSLILGAAVICGYAFLDIAFRVGWVSVDRLMMTIDVYQVWQYAVYIVGIPALSVGMMLYALGWIEGHLPPALACT